MGTSVSETHYRHISDLRHTDDDESLCSFLVMLVKDSQIDKQKGDRNDPLLNLKVYIV